MHNTTHSNTNDTWGLWKKGKSVVQFQNGHGAERVSEEERAKKVQAEKEENVTSIPSFIPHLHSTLAQAAGTDKEAGHTKIS